MDLTTRVGGVRVTKEEQLSPCNLSQDPFFSCCHLRLQLSQPGCLWNVPLPTMAAENRKLGSLGSRPGELASLKALISGGTVYAACALGLARGLLLCRVSTPQ